MRKLSCLLLTLTCLAVPQLRADSAIVVPTPAALAAEGGQLELAIELVYADQPAAMGLQLVLPAGWSYVGLAGEHVPQIAPSAGATESVECAWLRAPAGGAKFILQLSYPAGAKTKHLIGTVELRRAGKGHELQLVVSLKP